MHRTIRLLTLSVLTSTAVAGQAPANAAANTERSTVPASIVLVHGAFADASGWKHLIPLLERDGYHVIAVQNPLSSLAADVANTQRVIDAQPGAVILVGHSYGGAVISSAATGRANVKALVYVAAFAPDAGEPLGALLQKGPPSLLAQALAPDQGGYVYIDRAKFRAAFAADVSEAEARIMAVTQKPISGHVFEEVPASAAWRTLPTWYVIAQQDQAIHPDLQRMFATRMGATTSETKTSHVGFISQPREIAKVVREAAQAVTR